MPSPLLWVECGRTALPGHYEWLTGQERSCVRPTWRSKRLDDWLLGRWAAKRAIASVLLRDCEGPALRSIAVLPGASGAPYALVDGIRVPLSVSITHRDDHAVAAVLPHGGTVGCDLEKAEPRSPQFAQQFFTQDELDRIALMCRSCPASPHLEALFWSAKESVLKVLEVGLRADTRSIAIGLDEIDLFRQGWHTFSAAVLDGQKFTGWWQRSSGRFLTIAASCPTNPPMQLSIGSHSAASAILS